MTKLSHPGIVHIVQVQGEDRGYYFFVMEYLDGGDLRAGILEGRVISDDMVSIIREVGMALEHAHEHKIIHRDVKPSNILLDHRGRAQLTDFDLVLADDTTGGTPGDAMGTFIYSAPEVLGDATKASPCVGCLISWQDCVVRLLWG